MIKTVYTIALSALIITSACSSGNKETGEQQIESQIKSDEERMDSLEKAIQLQMEAVSDDSIVNQTIEP